jgi:hypothetical protein
MALTILDDTITSDQSLHSARVLAGEERAWEVSWLPGRPLDRNSAITAMVLADMTASEDMNNTHRLWPHIEGWAAELGLTEPDAAARTSGMPAWARPGRSALPADPEAAG